SSPSTMRISTRTTCRPSSIRRAWPSGRDTTVQSHSCTGWTCRRRPGQASTFTTPARISTPSSGPCGGRRSFSRMSLDDLYREVILDHYRAPRNKGRLEDATVVVDLKNPVCGDEIALYLKLDGGRVEAVRFEGRGCSISQASASMMTQAVRGKSLEEALELIERFKGMVRGELAVEEADLGDLEALHGVSKFPVRIKCAVLA